MAAWSTSGLGARVLRTTAAVLLATRPWLTGHLGLKRWIEMSVTQYSLTSRSTGGGLLICFQPDYMRFVEKSPRFRFFLVCSFFAPAARWVVLSVRVVSRDLFLCRGRWNEQRARDVSLSTIHRGAVGRALAAARAPGGRGERARVPRADGRPA